MARLRYRPLMPNIDPASPGTQGTFWPLYESLGPQPKTPDVLPLLYPFTAPPPTNITLASAWSVPPLEFCLEVRPNSDRVTMTRFSQVALSWCWRKYFRKPYMAQPRR